MEFYIHIGMQKTGSKALQRFLNKNSDPLARHRFRFARAFRDGLWHRQIFESFDTRMEASLREEFKYGSALILSYEDAYLAPLSTIEKITSLADKTKILLYVRDPVDWTNSYYNQLIKAHRISYARIANLTIASEDVCNRLNIGKHLERWESVVGRPNVQLTPFNRETCIYSSFLSWANIPFAARPRFSVDPGNPNKSADESSLKILLEVKRRIGEHNIEKLIRAITVAHNYLSDNWIDTRHEPGVMLLNSRERAEINAYYRRHLVKLFVRYGAEASDEKCIVRGRREVDRASLAALSPTEHHIVSEILSEANKRKH